MLCATYGCELWMNKGTSFRIHIRQAAVVCLVLSQQQEEATIASADTGLTPAVLRKGGNRHPHTHQS